MSGTLKKNPPILTLWPSDNIPVAMTSSTNSIFYISLSSTLLKGYQIQVIEVEPNTAQPKSQIMLSSENEIFSTDSIIHIGAYSTAPVIVWADKNFKTLKVNILGRKDIVAINIAKYGDDVISSVIVHAPASGRALPHFIVHYRSQNANWAEVYHVDVKKGSVSKAYDLPKFQGKGALSVSTIDHETFFIRHTDSEIILHSSESHGILERQPYPRQNTSGLPIDRVISAASEVVRKGTTTFAIRSARTLESGDVELIRNGEQVWTRPESLSGVTYAAWVDFSHPGQLAQELDYELHSNPMTAYIRRISRHLQDLKHLPHWLQELPGRVSNNFGSSVAASKASGNLDTDSYGFRKTIIVATEKGRVLALDTGFHGKILWSTQATEVERGGLWNVTHIDQLDRDSLRIMAQNPEKTVHISMSGHVSTQSHIDSRTKDGDLSIPFLSMSGKLELAQISQGVPIVSSLAGLDSRSMLVTQRPDGTITGWQKQADSLNEIWNFEPPTDEKIVDVVDRPAHDPVASIGRPLGDRNVLYKYISANLLLVITLNSQISEATVYLLDSVSGQLLHSINHKAVDTVKGIDATFSENWFAHTLYLDPDLASKEDAASTAKSPILVVSELYESSTPNDRGPLGSSDNVSSLTSTSYPPYVVSATYILPSTLSHLATTSTRQGITPRSILAYSSSLAALVAIPVALLSPRRPVGRDPTALEREEGLMQYSPFLDLHPQWILSHRREVLGINGIISTPSDMESTSLVFAYGELDVFGTRVAPIGRFDMLGKGFGKIQLILTVVALAIGTGVLAPMVCVDSSWPR